MHSAAALPTQYGVRQAGLGATNIIMAASWAVLTLAAAYQWLGDSRDYLEYVIYYTFIPEQLSFEDTRFEPGFHLVAWFFRHVLNWGFGQFAVVLLGSALAIKFYLFRKHLAHPLLAMVTYVMIFYLGQDYTQVRVSIALAFGYWAVHLMLDRKWVYGLLFFGLAATFHTSMILLPLAYIGARYLKGDLAAALIIAATLIIFAFSREITGFVGVTFSQFNPLLYSYLENRASYAEASLLSVNNLLLLGALGLCVLLGWYHLGRYITTFLSLSIASLIVFAVFAQSPIVAQRSKEVLFVSVIFLMYRMPISQRTFPPIALIWVMAGLLCYLAFREGFTI